jgi:hypothetical protein
MYAIVLQISFVYPWTLMMEAVYFSLVYVYWTSWYHIPEDSAVRSHRSENLRSKALRFVLHTNALCQRHFPLVGLFHACMMSKCSIPNIQFG